MAAGLAVPSMLSGEESQLYHWLGRQAQGFGATVDLGAFAGGSAARLLSGLSLSGQPHHLHAYDHFTASADVWARFLPLVPVRPTDPTNILPVAEQHLAPWRTAVTLHRGDIRDQRWHGGAVEVLVVDAAKGSAVADHIAAEFFPALVAGRSIVVQQDYLQPIQPWLPAQMVALADHFVPLARVASDCMVFLCRSVPTTAALAAARTDPLTDGALMKRVREAARWHEGMVLRPPFQAMLAAIKAHPGARLSWQLKKTGPGGGARKARSGHPARPG